MATNKASIREETQQLVTEQPATYQVEPRNHRRSLFNISEDLERLNELLDEVGNDTEQQEIISQWLESVGEERDRKLDNYASLISEMQGRAAIRKAEGQRM